MTRCVVCDTDLYVGLEIIETHTFDYVVNLDCCEFCRPALKIARDAAAGKYKSILTYALMVSQHASTLPVEL